MLNQPSVKKYRRPSNPVRKPPPRKFTPASPSTSVVAVLSRDMKDCCIPTSAHRMPPDQVMSQAGQCEQHESQQPSPHPQPWPPMGIVLAHSKSIVRASTLARMSVCPPGGGLAASGTRLGLKAVADASLVICVNMKRTWSPLQLDFQPPPT